MAAEDDDTEGAFSAFEEDAYPEAGGPSGYAPPARVQPAAPPEEEYDAYEEPQPAPVQIQGRRHQQPGNSAVRHKLAMAGYYNALDGYELFEEDGSPEAEQIRADLKAWIESQMEALVGVGTPKAADSPFTEEEVGALKTLAARVLNAPLDPRPQPPAPRPVPRPAPRPPQVARPQAQPPARPKKKRPTGDPRMTGETFEESRQLFRYVTNPEDPAGPKVRLNVTRSSRRPPTAQPFPSDRQIESVTADLADRTTRAATRGNEKLQKNILAALRTPA